MGALTNDALGSILKGVLNPKLEPYGWEIVRATRRYFHADWFLPRGTLRQTHSTRWAIHDKKTTSFVSPLCIRTGGKLYAARWLFPPAALAPEFALHHHEVKLFAEMALENCEAKAKAHHTVVIRGNQVRQVAEELCREFGGEIKSTGTNIVRGHVGSFSVRPSTPCSVTINMELHAVSPEEARALLRLISPYIKSPHH